MLSSRAEKAETAESRGDKNHGESEAGAGLSDKARHIWKGARRMTLVLQQETALTHHALRRAFEGATSWDDGYQEWTWKDAYEAAELAANLLILQYGQVLKIQIQNAREGLKAIERIMELEPPHTRANAGPAHLTQFSTPLNIAFVAAVATQIQPDDVVLEPSAGTGVLATMVAPELDAAKNGRLLLNELAADRAALLEKLFKNNTVSLHDAEELGNHLKKPGPSVVIMNPPFTTRRKDGRTQRYTDLVHVRSAYGALRPGGRLVTVTSTNCEPGTERWKRGFEETETAPQVAVTIPMDGRMFRGRGTDAHTRLTVLDKPQAGEHADETRLRSRQPVYSGNDLLETILGELAPRADCGSKATAAK